MSFETEKFRYLWMPREQKRQLYTSKNFVALEDIESWTTQFMLYVEVMDVTNNGMSLTKKYPADKTINDLVAVYVGDITTLEIEAIVNPTDNNMSGLGGVDQKVHDAAGRNLIAGECRSIGSCEIGQSKITGGYRLPANYVIHTVGPQRENPEMLASCYQTALEIVEQKKIKSVAFPCISTGNFGFPNEKAAEVALDTIRKWFYTSDYSKTIDRLIFALYLPVDINLYYQLMPCYFPLP